jgi:hypothetical protein
LKGTGFSPPIHAGATLHLNCPCYLASVLASTGSVHEQEFIRSFIQKERRERCSFLLSHPSRRRQFTAELAHFKWLDERFAPAVPGSMAHSAVEMVSLLKRNGAGPTVWIISEDRSIDGRALPLEEAMDCIWGGSMGSVLSCIPGKLAFFRGENMKSELLLQHS